jgi:hypothetical protein
LIDGIIGFMVALEPSVQGFSETVREYCKFIEEDDTAKSRVYVLRCLRLLLKLHLQALSLPNLEATGEPRAGIVVESEQWKLVRDRIASRLDRDHYLMVFDPFEEAPSPIAGSLSDDLSDVWRDLKEGLLQLDEGSANAAANAVWTWRFGLEFHWGPHHSAHAIGALHALLYGEHAL